MRENILFGREYDRKRYNHVVKICQLIPDLKMLPGGDLTQIGERGINISGGQKQRISIARAVYSNSNIYLIDDALSALDAHVGSKIMEDVFKTELKDKTKILVTHKIDVLKDVERIVLMKNGTIIEDGPRDEVMESESFEEYSKTKDQ